MKGNITKWKLSDSIAAKKWTVLLFYPKVCFESPNERYYYRLFFDVFFLCCQDFTYVCPTELIAFNDAALEFEAINTQLVGISTDTEECHLAWTRVPRKQGGLGDFQVLAAPSTLPR